MHPNFSPPRGMIVVLLFFGLTVFSFAADKKRKSVPEAKSKTKAKVVVSSKNQARRESSQEKQVRRKSQLARKQSADVKGLKKHGKQAAKLAKQREEIDKARGKTKTAKRENDKKSGKQKADVATKKTPAENDTKLSKSLAKAEITETISNSKSQTKTEDKTKNLTPSKYTLRPIAKVVPKGEWSFGVAGATVVQASDEDSGSGPDVIDVIEHESPEAQRLDDLLRSEMKTLPYSGVPSVSRRKRDVGKMDTDRIKQIQEALTKKGFYAGAITGQYDDATIEAMRKFQETNRIDVTGYATAQSLRLLGLTDW
jgi:hypothetical protein